MPARRGAPLDLAFPKSLEFYQALREEEKSVSACAAYVRLMDGVSVFQDYVL